MRRSVLFTKTVKDISKDEVSKNAQLLLRAGMVNQLMAGVYTYLPLGLRVLNRIEQIVRQEMDAIGAQELIMPALHPRDIWDTTGRWDGLDVLFRLKGAGDRDLALGATHEEVVTPLAQGIISSYRDLPMAVYQVQTKFRNEPRAKSGLMRGREFRMKDMYSFHATQDDLDAFYDKAIGAYQRVYERLGLGERTLLTFASGGTFSKYSHEFQTMTESGEDLVYRVPGTQMAFNEEVIGDHEALAGVVPGYKKGDEASWPKVKAVEVGNIFKLGTKYSKAFGLTFTDKDGTPKNPVMGCYGIGPSRMMGTIAEVLSDEHGLVWPVEIAPYTINLIGLRMDDAAVKALTDKLYQTWQARGIEVLFDDRDTQAGEKFADADLLGCPWQAIVGPKGAAEGKVEWKNRATGEKSVLSADQLPF